MDFPNINAISILADNECCLYPIVSFPQLNSCSTDVATSKQMNNKPIFCKLNQSTSDNAQEPILVLPIFGFVLSHLSTADLNRTACSIVYNVEFHCVVAS